MKDLLTSMDAEWAVLGSILVDGKCLRSVSQKLREDDFSTQVNRDVYRTMLALDTDDKFVDGTLVAAAMRQHDPEEDKALQEGYIALIGLAMNVLETGIRLLGFSAPEKM